MTLAFWQFIRVVTLKVNVSQNRKRVSSRTSKEQVPVAKKGGSLSVLGVLEHEGWSSLCSFSSLFSLLKFF